MQNELWVSECVYVDCVEQRHHGGVTTDDRNSKLTFLLVEYEKKPAYLIAFLYVCVHFMFVWMITHTSILILLMNSYDLFEMWV